MAVKKIRFTVVETRTIQIPANEKFESFCTEIAKMNQGELNIKSSLEKSEIDYYEEFEEE